MNLRKLLVGGVLTIAVTGNLLGASVAQEISESHLNAARSAIASIGATDRFDDILPDIALGIKTGLIQNNPNLEEIINEIVDSETIALASRRGDLETEAATIYAKTLSEEHLITITDFYNSEAGRAFLDNGALITRTVQEGAGVWQRGIARDLEENVIKKLAEAAPQEAAPENAGENSTEGETPAAQ